MRTLVLDNNYFPVRIINWQRAMILLFSGRAEIVTEYQEIKIQGASQLFNLPKILRLFNRHQNLFTVKFSRQNVFWRDNFQCQYCLVKLPASKLTLDHVIPQSKNGKTDWENVVACCAKCNSKKGDKLLKDISMKLNKIPKRPKWTPQMCLKLKNDDPLDWNDWFPEVLAS